MASVCASIEKWIIVRWITSVNTLNLHSFHISLSPFGRNVERQNYLKKKEEKKIAYLHNITCYNVLANMRFKNAKYIIKMSPWLPLSCVSHFQYIPWTLSLYNSVFTMCANGKMPTEKVSIKEKTTKEKFCYIVSCKFKCYKRVSITKIYS